MQGFKRRLVYASVYELIAILLTTALLVFALRRDFSHSSAAAIIASIIALSWNLIYNLVFEFWEARQSVKGRSFKRRLCHAIGFELGLTIILVPFFAWWLGISLVASFMLDLSVTIFFFFYTYIYNLAFDCIFGLPTSAQAH